MKPDHLSGDSSGGKEIFRGTTAEIAKVIKKGELLEPGGHIMLVYKDLASFTQVYSKYAAASLSEDEILLLATQYQAIETVKSNLAITGVDVASHLNDGTLFIIDAQQGYFSGDLEGTFKLALTLVSRVRKERRRGFSWIGDMGSFFALEKFSELLDYELSAPRKFENAMKTLCCYHSADFENLYDRQKKALFGHHYKSIVLD